MNEETSPSLPPSSSTTTATPSTSTPEQPLPPAGPSSARPDSSLSNSSPSPSSLRNMPAATPAPGPEQISNASGMSSSEASSPAATATSPGMTSASPSTTPSPTSRRPGRPRKYGPRTSTAIRINPDLHARLTTAADERDLSVNWLVNRAVERFLDRLLPLDQIKLTNDD